MAVKLEQHFMIVSYYDSEDFHGNQKRLWYVHYEQPGHIEELLNNLQGSNHVIFSICPVEREKIVEFSPAGTRIER